MENLRLAFWKAQRGKQGKREVMVFREDLDAHLSRLREGLLSGDVPIGEYSYFTINDPKERVICAASFSERVVHHAIMNVCEKEFERYQIFDSYACRKGKGVDCCLKRMQQMCGRFAWYLKLDVHKYFDSISHDILKRLLRRHFKDTDLLLLFDRIIDSYNVSEGRGIPIGNLTSQFFANMYLGLLDHQVKDVWRNPGYVRYMDDFVLFFDTREDAKEMLDQVRDFLENELALELNQPQLNKTRFGIPALSYRVFTGHLRLSLKAKRRFKRKMSQAIADGERERMLPLLSFVERADCLGIKKKVCIG